MIVTTKDEWPSNLEWRQGDFLAHEAATALGLIGNENNVVVAVISHDCDLARPPEDEPVVEVIIGRRVPECDANNLHGKNPRCLHIELPSGNCVELHATRKTTVPKQATLLGHPCPNLNMTSNQRRTLHRWLASRYSRAAMPDEFNNRLKSTKLNKKLATIFKKYGKDILAIYVDLDDGAAIERKDGDPYELSLYLLYDAEIADKAAVEEARRLVEEAFKEKCLKNGKWEFFELLECEAYSDEEVTLGEHRKLTVLSWDYLSFRDETEVIQA